MKVKAVLITCGQENRNYRCKRSVSCVVFWLADVLELWKRNEFYDACTDHDWEYYL